MYQNTPLNTNTITDTTLSGFTAGEHEQQREYQSFLPNLINREWKLTDAKTLSMLDDATRLVGELNAFAKFVPDVDFFITMHIAKEATTSSRIEGTRTNVEEALTGKEDIDPEKRDDWQEVQNYIKAMRNAIDSLQDIPLSVRLLKQAHHDLMQGVRGQHKQPGEFRTSQNWIGTSLKNAVFVPPHHERLPDLMSDFEKFIHNDGLYVPHLIKLAILHYQFETIHPFLDGNGRLGRLLIILYMVDFGLMTKPALYLSDFFERYKGDYYDRLTQVRTRDKLLEWVQFFLEGIQQTAQQSIDVFNEIIKLKDRINTEVIPKFHTRKLDNAVVLHKTLYANPIINIGMVAELLNVSHSTASSLINDFVKLNILAEITETKRNKLFVFKAYIDLFG